MTNKLDFIVRTVAGAPGIVPVIDLDPLDRLLDAYERSKGHDPAGGYDGLIPGNFEYGPLEPYFLGQADDAYWAKGSFYLLGCECGEVGCWPIRARIIESGETIVWRDFHQEHRPGRDYAGFGPFIFQTSQYLAAVRRMMTDPALAAADRSVR